MRVRPRLLKSYVHSLSTSKSAVIVLEATYVAADGSSTVRTYRGQYVAMNWASGTGETIAAFRMAGASCVRQVQVELEKMLRQ